MALVFTTLEKKTMTPTTSSLHRCGSESTPNEKKHDDNKPSSLSSWLWPLQHWKKNSQR